MAYRRDKDPNKIKARVMSGTLYSRNHYTSSHGYYQDPYEKTAAQKAKAIWEAAVETAAAKKKKHRRRGRMDPKRRYTAGAAPIHFRRRARYPQEEKNGFFYFFVASAGAILVGMTAALCLAFSGIGGQEIVVNDGGKVFSAKTKASTVGGFFENNGIQLGTSDVLEVSLSTPVEEGMEIVIRRAVPVTIHNGNSSQEVMMLTGTVEDALAKSGVVYDPEDEIYPDPSTNITKDMVINIVQVDVVTVTQQETLHYKEITRNDSSLAKGKKILHQKGETGLQEHEIRIVYKNDHEVSREVVKTTVIKEPKDEIVLIGTYVAPKPTKRPTTGSSSGGSKPSPTKKPSGGDTGADNKKDESGNLTQAPSINQIHSGTLNEHKKVPAPASSLIAKTLVMDSITAYTHTGNPTATGRWPSIGTVAANPKQIPYGTKLYIPGYGYGRVEDTGSNRHAADYYCIDLFMETKAECRTWGRKRNVKVYILK